MEALRYVGRPIARSEDRRLLMGKGCFVGDIRAPDMVECMFVRSSLPHAGIKGVSVGCDAKVYLWDDIEHEVGFLPAITRPQGSLFPNIAPLAHDKVRFLGEPIAVVVGGDGVSRYRLQDTAEEVVVEYERLEPVFDVEAASKADAPLLFPELGTNILYRSTIGGDVDDALASSHRVFSRRLVFPANYGAALEPRGVVAKYDVGSGLLTVWSSTQWPHFVRTLLSEVLGLHESKIRVVAPDVGGGFGNKQDLYREEVVVSWLATKLGRPVRWVATRSEDMSSTVQSGLQVHYVELGLSREGTIKALRDRIYADLGSVGPMSFGPSVITQLSVSGPYRIGSVSVELNCVATNKPPTGAYRGYGQQQASYAVERMVEEAAWALGVHPLELRRRNVVEGFPYTTPTGRVLDSGNYIGMIEACLPLMEAFKPKTSDRLVGVGFAFGFESGGIGPVCLQDAVGARHKGFDSVRLRVEADGSVTVYTGLSPHGQGLETTLSQVAAELLGVRLEEVRVVCGDTESCPYGYGTWGSRSAVVGAGALLKAVGLVKTRIVEAASKILKMDAAELEYREGWILSRKSGERLIHLKNIAAAMYSGSESSAPLDVTVSYEPQGLTVSGGLHAAAVEVDAETGQIRVLRYALVHDSGRAINPLIVEGQIVGGLAQGVGEALLEEFDYNVDGSPLSSNLTDYALPTPLELPKFELIHLDTPTPLNPLGLKGVGESGIVGPAAAIANAVANALGTGCSDLKIPLRAENVWREAVGGGE